jgi:hypothetical protein
MSYSMPEKGGFQMHVTYYRKGGRNEKSFASNFVVH